MRYEKAPGENREREGQAMLQVSGWQLTSVILLAVWAGSQIGHLLTLWQIEAKYRHDQRDQGNE